MYVFLKYDNTKKIFKMFKTILDLQRSWTSKILNFKNLRPSYLISSLRSRMVLNILNIFLVLSYLRSTYIHHCINSICKASNSSSHNFTENNMKTFLINRWALLFYMTTFIISKRDFSVFLYI